MVAGDEIPGADMRARRLEFIAWTAGLLTASSVIAHADDKLIKVDWESPEVRGFIMQRQSAAPTAAGPLDKVRLPVLAFAQAPGLVQNAFPGLGPQPMGERTVSTDDANPVWYQIVDTYGDVSVSVQADLRVQHEMPADYKIYDTTPPGGAPQAGPQVSVFDAAAEEGMEGFIAEYTIEKFGVPYTVTIECSAATKERCADQAQIVKDSMLLTIVAASPPG